MLFCTDGHRLFCNTVKPDVAKNGTTIFHPTETQESDGCLNGVRSVYVFLTDMGHDSGGLGFAAGGF